MDRAVSAWTEAEVQSWLWSVELGEWEGVFADNNVTGEVLLEMSHALLKEMGVASVGKRVVILKAIGKLAPAAAAPRESEKDAVIETLKRELDEIKASLVTLKSESRRTSLATDGPPLPPPYRVSKEQRMDSLATVYTIADIYAAGGAAAAPSSPSPSPSQPATSTRERSGSSAMNNPITSMKKAIVGGVTNVGGSFSKATSNAMVQQMSSKAFFTKDEEAVATASPSATTPSDKNQKGFIRLVGDSLRQYENYKTVAVTKTDTCQQVIRVALKKYSIAQNAVQMYALFVHVQGKERCLKYDDCPLQVKYHIQASHKTIEPMFILRHLRQLSNLERQSIGANATVPQTAAAATAPVVQPASKTSPTADSTGIKWTTSPIRQSRSFNLGAQSASEAKTLAEPVYAVGVYTYEATMDDELSVAIGEQVTVYKQATGWWYCGDQEGKFGWTPSGCLDVVTIEKMDTKLGVALFDYTSVGANELTVSKGDKMTVQSRHQHWLLAEAQNGTLGWIPSCYVSVDGEEQDGTATPEEWQQSNLKTPIPLESDGSDIEDIHEEDSREGRSFTGPTDSIGSITAATIPQTNDLKSLVANRPHLAPPADLL